jgi:hypothetical protein
LNEIVKLSDDNKEGKNRLIKAKEKLEELSDMINKKKRDIDQIYQVIKMQSIIEGITIVFFINN